MVGFSFLRKLARIVDMDTGRLLSRGVAETIVRQHLEQALNSGKKLRVKFGIDPTAPDLHLGHTVPLRKLREFQDAGHQIVLIIGDFTAQIGDPTGRSEARKPLTEKEVKINLKKYLTQAGRILNMGKVEAVYNSKWHNKMDKKELGAILTQFTVQQLLEREDFQKRLAEHRPLWMIETFYPALQAYDSVMIKADVEVGGTDQKFNMLAGRALMEKMGMDPQDVVTLPLLEGTDGVKKMSKSIGNYIGLDELPSDMFGKIMAIPDNLINKYYELLTDQERKTSDPREAKLELGRIIVGMYHGAKEGEKAKEEFVRVFSKGGVPADRPKMKELAGLPIVDALVKSGAASSKSEARRLVEQGGVEFDSEKVKDVKAIVPVGIIVKVGKHFYFDT